MLSQIHPILPMRNKALSIEFYVNRLGFKALNPDNFDEYLMVRKDDVEIHFFLSPNLKILEHAGMCYIRTSDAKAWYELALKQQLDIPELGHLKQKPWMQREFSVRDPDMNLLTFGQSVV